MLSSTKSQTTITQFWMLTNIKKNTIDGKRIIKKWRQNGWMSFWYWACNIAASRKQIYVSVKWGFLRSFKKKITHLSFYFNIPTWKIFSIKKKFTMVKAKKTKKNMLYSKTQRKRILRSVCNSHIVEILSQKWMMSTRNSRNNGRSEYTVHRRNKWKRAHKWMSSKKKLRFYFDTKEKP